MNDKVNLPKEIRKRIEKVLKDDAAGNFADKDVVKQLFMDFNSYANDLEIENIELQRALEDQKEFALNLSGLLDEAPFGYLIIDADFIIRTANKTFLDISGTSITSLLNTPLTGLIDPSNVADFRRQIKQTLKSGKKQKQQLTLRVSSGFKTVLFESEQVNQGTTSFIRCSFSDISVYNNLESVLKQSQLQYQNLMEVLKDGIVLLDKKCNIIEANQVFSGMVGYSLKELHEMDNFFMLSSEVTRHWEQEEVWNKLVRDGFSDIYEKEFICKNGQLLTVEFYFNAIPVDKGKPGLFWGIAKDISERIRAGKALLEQDERFDAVTLFINEWEYWRGIDGKIQYVSPACERISGYSTAEFEKNSNLLEQIIHPDDLSTFRKHKVLTGHEKEGAEIHSLNFRIICKDKTIKWIGHSCQNIRTSDGTYLGIRGNNRDITEKKQIEVSLEDKNKSLSFLNKVAIELASLPEEGNLPDFLIKQLKEFTNGIFVSYSEYDPSEHVLRTRHIDIDNETLKKVLNLINQDELNIESPVSEETYKIMTETIVGIRHTISEITFGAIPEVIGKVIKSILNADRFYGIVYMAEGELYGTSVIALRKDQPDPPVDFLVSFAHLTAVSLRRKKAEQSLRESEERVRITLYSIGDAVISTDRDGLIRKMNPVAEKLTGWTEAESRGKILEEVFNIINEESHEKVENPVKKVLREGMVIGLANHTLLVSKTGNEIPITDSGAPIKNRDGGIDGVILVFRDQTDERAIQNALFKEKETARQYFNIAGVIMLVLDEVGCVKHINKKGCEILGFGPEDIIGKEWFANFLPVANREEVYKIYREIMAGDLRINEYFENTILCKNGDEKLIAWHNSVVADDNGKIMGTLSSGDDITLRRQIEVALRDSEEKYRSLIENMLDAVIILDFDGNIKFYNSSALKLYSEKTDLNLLGESMSRFLHPDSLFQAISDLEKVKNAESISTQYKIVNEMGEIRWIEVSSTKTLYQGNESVLVILHDITGRKRMEEEIKYHSGMQNLLTKLGSRFINVSRNRVDTAIKEAMEEIGEFTDVDRVYLFEYDFNKGIMINTYEWCAQGISPEIDNLQAVPMADLPEWVATHQKSEPIYVPDVMKLDPADNLRMILEPQNIKSLITIPMTLEHNCLGFVGFDSVKTERYWSHDEVAILKLFAELLTNLKIKLQFESKLLEVESINQFITANITDAVCLVDTDGRYTYVTPSHKAVTGRGEELIGENFLKYIHAEDYKKVLHIVVTGTESGSAKNVEYRYLHPKKGYIWLESTGKRHYDTNGNLFGLITSRNINERMKAQAELIAAKEKAEESDHLKTAFLNNMSHEIRTPLNVIMGFTELLRDPLKSQDEYHYFSRIITQSSNHLLSIINDIMSIATIEAGQEKIRESLTDINRMLERLYNEFAIRIESQEVVFYFTSKLPDDKAKVITDETKVIQIISNLISNAIKFTQKGKIEFGCHIENNFLKFFVEDTGIGIPAAYHKRIFERFRQVDDNTTRKYGGNGLGLSISKAYVELLGGKIHVESEPGKGSKFLFTIPFKPAVSDHNLSVDFNDLEKTQFIQGIKNLLIAEDEMSNYLLLEKLLANDPFRITHVVNGKQAVEACKTDPSIDLVLMDLKMPVMDGLTATGLIKIERPDLPVIALTAYALSGDKEKAIKAGCDEYISKPFNKKDLMATMYRFLKVN